MSADIADLPYTAMTEAQSATAPVSLTSAAAEKVRELLAQEVDGSMALRIAVRPGGCSGFSYDMFFDGEHLPGDARSVQYGVAVAVDPASRQLLEGATLDYRDGLNEAGFKITNPNATRSCGCGSSFS